MDIQKISLTLPNLPFSLDWLPTSACLVGGAVRDALLNRKRSYLDLDFVLPEKAVETAREIANYYQAGFVILDSERQIARVVFSQGTLDFALQEGKNLETDLNRRDFTINAIAYHLHQQELIDPLKGYEDLQQGLIRMVSANNLKEDPLRLLRAYRQAAQLNFTIENTTRETIKNFAYLLPQVAAERVQTELNYLLAIPTGSAWLAEAWQDGLLKFYFPEISNHNLEHLQKIKLIAQDLQQKWNHFGSNIDNWLSLAKLTILVAQEASKAEAELLNLKYSRTEIKAVIATVNNLARLRKITSSMSLREQYFFFLEVKNIFPILVVVAMAEGVSRTILNPLIDRYLNPQDLVAHPQSLVNGHDLIEALKLKPSPLIGQLLTEIQIAQIEGKIKTSTEALQLADSLLKQTTD